MKELTWGCSTEPAVDPPRPLSDLVGTLEYYRMRHLDYLRRHDTPPPSYYLKYGDKYARRFQLQARPELSPKGQGWLDRVLVELQRAIENKLLDNPQKFDELEQNCAAFKAFACGTHYEIYRDAGLRSLPIEDLVLIARTLDPEDLNRDAAIVKWFAAVEALWTERQGSTAEAPLILPPLP